ncbi:hypothetical protein P261_02667 [Lachnospiraceae bacterium TWA4]|nr:hypothetical protein P261_02667 [Lachnospiraceae bacterium TWA4]
MQKQLDTLCMKTGNRTDASDFVSDELERELHTLKVDGKVTEAVKMLRKNTTMDLVEAKKFVDSL